MRNAFDIDVPLADFLAAPNVAALAVLVEELIMAELEQLSEEEVELLSQD